MEKIAVLGTGYVGLVTGAGLADFGNEVTCVDLDETKIATLKQGKIPFYEFSLGEVVERNVREGRLSFSSDLIAAIRAARTILIAVGTPPGAKGEADLSQVFGAARTIAEQMTSYKLIVQKSTVPVGTGEKVLRLVESVLAERGKSIAFDVASNPEFLREGSAVEDFMRPDRIVIGTWSPKAEHILSGIYQRFYLNETPMIRTTVQSAELIKYASNAFLATKISFINEMANLCEAVGGDVKVVARAMGLDGRIGRKFLHAGPGYGGSCFPKDTLALASFSRAAGEPSKIVEATIDVNKRQRRRMLEKVRDLVGSLSGKEIAVLGLSFKPQTDDVRDSVAIDLIKLMQKEGANVRAFDPVAMERAAAELRKVEFAEDSYSAVKGADALVIATEWNEFRTLDLTKLLRLMRQPAVVDCRNIYDPATMEQAGFRYVSVGRSTYVPDRSGAPASGGVKKVIASTNGAGGKKKAGARRAGVGRKK
ncbi:MAG: UDP-glucose/GDP-mannose dehydrogenase family protein [Candidatus Eisenbacteria bacterium]|uniref:UDP-glucose 6-dehydrogenase n=1 Tax=Eiseniibacteriota bacterium TaxID=2212470 RepID=A0A956LZS3_UNCEI|nr:UDP-glucose/GDP-mannose dehydrogenase family protein [Candidatus Eisenbacteria bacterium]